VRVLQQNKPLWRVDFSGERFHPSQSRGMITQILHLILVLKTVLIFAGFVGLCGDRFLQLEIVITCGGRTFLEEAVPFLVEIVWL
jgi:hypothetical protein